MNRENRKGRFCLLIFVCLTFPLWTGCASQNYMTSFTPRQEPQRYLDMSYNGPRANVAVGDFRVKARGASSYIGDGLREMLETALFESRRFNTLDRMDMKGLAAEQSLSYSKMAKPGSPRLGRQMEVARLLVYGAVTEFEANAGGMGIRAAMPGVPITGGAMGKNAHMAIDVRVVDTATGRIVAARRLAGSAASFSADLATRLFGGTTTMPVSLAAYKNTPMELAIRDCIYRAVIYLCNSIPREYFTSR